MTTDTKKTSIIPAEQLGLPADTSGLNAYAARAKLRGVDFLRVNGKTGRVAYGVEDTELPADAKLAAVIAGTQVGYIDWDDGEKVEDWIGIAEYNAENMQALRQGFGKLDQALWERNDKGRPVDPIKEAVQLPLLWLDARKPMIFSASSDGGCRAVQSLLKRALAEILPGHVPIVEIEVGEYPLKKYGKVFYPVFRVIGSKTEEDVRRIMNGAAAPGGAPQVRTAEHAPVKQAATRR
jgi:hypothetical protein